MLRILIADDHEIVRRGVRAQLTQRTGWEVCGEAVNGREAIDLARQLRPELAVLDLSMPELNGIEATRHIKREFPNTEVLILTMHDSEQTIRAAVAAGARGYLLKSDDAYHLNNAIEALACHRPYFSPRVAEKSPFVNATSNAEKCDSLLLTAREREVMQMLTEGKSNREVARRLQISVKTVETHRAKVMRKLDVNSIVELVRYAIRNQIVEA